MTETAPRCVCHWNAETGLRFDVFCEVHDRTMVQAEETPCSRRDDRTHCHCWYDGDACCACGDPPVGAAVVRPMPMTMTVKLNAVEIAHLLALLADAEDKGDYYGNRQQYWKRHFRIETKLLEARP